MGEVNWGPEPFRNLDAWFTHPSFVKLIEDEWKNLGSMDVLCKFNRLKLPIRKWNKEKFGNFEFNNQRLEGELDVVAGRLDEGSLDEVDIARYNALKSQIEVWYERKQCHWRQMSRERILKDMDKNSKFFHAKAAVRSRRKLMLEVRSGRGIFRAPRMIKMKARNFYRNLYKQKPMPIIYFPQELVNKISEEEANLLEQRPACREIKQAVWAYESSRARALTGTILIS